MMWTTERLKSKNLCRFREYFNSVLFCLPRCFYRIKARSLRYKDDHNQETPKMLRKRQMATADDKE